MDAAKVEKILDALQNHVDPGIDRPVVFEGLPMRRARAVLDLDGERFVITIEPIEGVNG